ncbi:hypothetical protein [Aliivibrio fischeri]|uniref:hypothetical protein n=1 Tax=Aliivibrio fischeri TaxID=668 RepID=UPI00084C8CF2|nr:hypothetical protein [Aliivibrio fischeri]OED51251.1 hypothetical protein BEI47_20185 [Aliivibrio fischeri]
MHSNNDIRKVRVLDGLAVAFGIIEYNYDGLLESCNCMQGEEADMAEVLSRSWSIIDSVHRVNQLIQATPGLNQKQQVVKDYLSVSLIAKEFRNYVQHLSRELGKKEPDPFPVWGSISWVDLSDDKLCHTALIGTQIEGTTLSSCVYDTEEEKWVSKVCLSVRGLAFNFDIVVQAVRELKRFVIPWILNSYEPGIDLSTKFPIYSARVE